MNERAQKTRLLDKVLNAARRFSSGSRRVNTLRFVTLISIAITVIYIFTPVIVETDYRIGDVVVDDVIAQADMIIDGVDIERGDMIAEKGAKVDKELLARIEAVTTASKRKNSVTTAVGFFAMSIIFLYTVYRFSAANIRKFMSAPKDLLCMALLLVGVLGILKFAAFISLGMGASFPGIPSALYLYIAPVAGGAMMIRLLMNSETAMIFGITSSIFSGLLLGGSIEMSVYFFIGSVVAAMKVRHCTQRSTILKAGAFLGIVNVLVIISGTALKGGGFSPGTVLAMVSGMLGGLIAAIMVTGITPVFEILFGYTTDIKLLELSRMDHPLLKELAIKAPGTYHHSLVIGSLVEAAAEAINVNPLLARVSAYYHDIGKMKKPLYFVENMKGENRHDKLAPSMSALILISHVKDGLEMANKYKLGEEIINVIQQHHGTSLTRYFYHKAKETEDPEVHEINEEDFRYPGPKPQTREAGLVMLADAIEAASKTIPDPNPAKIQGMVQKIINRIFTDGQLDECELTLKDLNAIAISFNRVLNGIFHQRIEYPEPAYVTREEAGEDTGTEQPKEKDGDKKGKGGHENGIRRLGARWK